MNKFFLHKGNIYYGILSCGAEFLYSPLYSGFFNKSCPNKICIIKVIKEGKGLICSNSCDDCFKPKNGITILFISKTKQAGRVVLMEKVKYEKTLKI